MTTGQGPALSPALARKESPFVIYAFIQNMSEGTRDSTGSAADVPESISEYKTQMMLNVLFCYPP